MRRHVSRFKMVGISGLMLLAAVGAWKMPSLAQQPGEQPPGGQPPGGGRGRFGFGPGGFDPSQMIDRMLEMMQLSEAERTAAKETWTAKNTARTALREKVERLREVADNTQSTDADINKALSEFATAYGAYAKTVAEADAKLVKKISLRTRAKLTAAGILENGVGFMGGFRFGGFGRPGGPGGGDRRGGAGDGGRPGGAGIDRRSDGQINE
ncbi:MAG: hypothetical protein NZT92_15530 [Abditibacteriales bacterium]|nr:hypothetical protein [Abditibacteriales bacterium]